MLETHLYSISKGVYRDSGKSLPIYYSMVNTPHGRAFFAESCGRVVCLSLGSDEEQLLNDFNNRWNLSRPLLRPDHCQRMVDEIFSSAGNCCARILLMGTDFQIRVWEALTHITEGSVTTYKNIADEIGQPDAVQAVANAISDNPIACLIPCHRVIRTDGSLGGCRWGIESKRSFLEAEGYDLNQLIVA